MIPTRFAPILFGLLLSGMMTIVVSGISVLQALGLSEGFLLLWLFAWLSSWAVAFPLVLLIAPLTRRIVARLTG
ncbi:MAG: DUF2798 domain-containing protein [Rhodobacteraceae bacterium]|nr:DUF2798 domain-containing protein [Paracoccaceae bacterium]